MTMPLISICIPTYRYGRYIAQAIESVITQDFKDFELIIVDDASDDCTTDVVSRYAREDSRIIFEVNQNNRGMVQNWNYCLSKCRGKYIKYLFADDYFNSPAALGQMLSSMEENPEVSLVFSARAVVDETGAQTRILSHFGEIGRAHV